MPDDGAAPGTTSYRLPHTFDRPTFDPDVADAALAGLLASRKTLPARLFYDEAGCRLFDAITTLPEYYPTRTEMALLPEVARELASLTPERSALVEYGGCDETKASLLLRHPRFAAYVPIDVAAAALTRLRRRMAQDWPALRVAPVVADFLQPVSLPEGIAGLNVLGFFPGSTIGNLDPAEIQRFLLQARTTLGPRAGFLVGADLRKDPAISAAGL